MGDRVRSCILYLFVLGRRYERGLEYKIQDLTLSFTDPSRVEDGHDTLVADLPLCLDLDHEAFEGQRVVGELGTQDFECDILVAGPIVHEIHDANAAAAQ